MLVGPLGVWRSLAISLVRNIINKFSTFKLGPVSMMRKLRDIDRKHPPVVINGYSVSKYHQPVFIGQQMICGGRFTKISLPRLSFMQGRVVSVSVVLYEKHPPWSANHRRRNTQAAASRLEISPA